jgi:hypothetical protein
VLVIIVIGIGAFFLAKIFGGGREVSNATDAGTLNVAKQALRSNNAAFTMSGNEKDFWPLEDPALGVGNHKITLFTYNRCVAQALLVALNADQEGTPQAKANAQTVFDTLRRIGAGIKGQLILPATLQGDFTQVASNNNTRMFGGGANYVADAQHYTYKWMKDKGSTNIYFDPSTLSGLPSAGQIKYNLSADKVPPAGAEQGSYMSGYDPINVPNAGINGTLVGVPVFPQQKPHLVGVKDFDSSAFTDPNSFAPPNAFKITTQSTEQKSGNNLGGAVACAIVGAVKANGGENPDFKGIIPGGYIEIANLPPLNVLPYQAADPNAETNSIFNNELYNGPLELSDQGPQTMFSTSSGALQAWADYNASESPPGPAPTAPDTLDSNNRWTSKQPTAGQGFPNNSPTVIYVATGGGGSTPATQADLLALKNGKRIDCTQDLIATNLSDSGCSGNLQSFQNAYGRGTGGGSLSSNPNTPWSAVDGMKLDLITQFNSGAKSARVMGGVGSAPNAKGVTATGLGKWKSYPTPPPFYEKWPTASGTTPMESTGTVGELLNEVGSCVNNQLLGDMLQRVNEIKPGTSMGALQAMLNAPSAQIPMRGNLYIHLVDPKNPSSALVCDANQPSTYTSGLTADGPTSGPDFCDSPQYDLYNGGVGMIDTAANFGNKGDNNLHDRPYRSVSGNLTGQDHAYFQTSSGFGNLLGKLEFSNTTQGEDDFSRPN